MTTTVLPPAPQTAPAPLGDRREGTKRARALLAGGALLVLIVVMFLATLTFGSVFVPVRDVLAALLGEDGVARTSSRIVLELRLPRAVAALAVGAALGTAGLQMQTLFRNPLASPSTLGINAGASLGVALVVLPGGIAGAGLFGSVGFAGRTGSALAAALGAAATMLLLMVIARRVTNGLTLLIIGLMIGYAASAAVSVLIYVAESQSIQSYIVWTFGTFATVTVGDLALLGGSIAVGLGLAWLTRNELNVLLLGDRYARTMGVSVRRIRALTIVSASLLAGTVTAFCGPVAFIGVAAPHLARGLFGTSDHRVLLPGAMLVGAVIALVAGFVAHVPGSASILPLNAVTALSGAPVVIAVLRSRRLARAMAQ